MNRIFIKIVSPILLTLSFVLLATTAFILAKGFQDHIKPSDVGIIFGSKIQSDGHPSARLIARLEKGRELYQQGYFKHIIVSGGIGKEGFDEAAVMKAYLVANQVPADSIIEDNQGINSAATAKNSSKIMKDHHFKTALLISQYFHMARAELAFRKYGITPIYHAHANYFEWRDLYSTPREVVAFYAYQL